MGDKIKEVGAKLKGFWGGLSKVMRILLVGGLAAVLVIAIIVVVVLTAGKNDGYMPLFEGMDQTETTEVYNELRSQNVDVKIVELADIVSVIICTA